MGNKITIIGAGVVGLWQALTLARRGHQVTLVERHDEPGRPWGKSASRLAGAMLAPDCESVSAPELVREQGHEGLSLWRETYPQTQVSGTLVVASARDAPELAQFARKTVGHTRVAATEISSLEPELEGRFEAGLYFENEAHMSASAALEFLVNEAIKSGCRFKTGHVEGSVETLLRDADGDADIVIDCRGMRARGDLADLRGVRGELAVVETREVQLSRPVRLLHPRHPLYVVPWGGGRFAIGATVIESDDDGPMTLRSALELLGMAYALIPAFGEAQIVNMAADVRPAFPDNVPRIVIRADGRVVHVNGAYRHGFLLAPVLARVVGEYVDNGDQAHAFIKVG